MVIGLYKAVALRRFSFGSEILKKDFWIVNNALSSRQSILSIYISQSKLKLQDFAHLLLGPLSLGSVQDRHVDLVAVVGFDDWVVESLDQILAAQA